MTKAVVQQFTVKATVTPNVIVKASVSNMNIKATALAAGPTGQGVPNGGTTGQILTKNSTNPYDTSWITPTSGTGDMTKAVYDTNNDGVVDNSQALNSQNAAYYLNRTNHTGTQAESTVTNLVSDLAGKEPTITAGTSAQYYRGDKTFQTLNQDAVPDGTTNKVYSAADKTRLANTSGTNTGDQTTVTGNAGTATTLQTARTIGTQTGDVTSTGSTFNGSSNNTNATTLATVNSNVGSFTYASITVNGKGLITAASSGTTPEVPLTFSTGLTRSTNTVTVNTSQNIAKLSNLTTNGFVKTSAGDGTLSVDTTTYLSSNQTITLSGDITGSGSTAITTTYNNVVPASKGGAGTVTGLLKANGTGTVSSATAGTDYQAPITLTTTGTSGAATFIGNTLNIPSYAGGGSSGITRSVSTLTTSATLGSTSLVDYVVFVGSGGAPTLPTAVGNTNRYTVKNVHTTNKTLATTSSQTIDGSTTITLTPNQSVDLVSDNTAWRVI